jgi:predicted  nucleic acid-binding Zn-ribbon protein
MTSAADLFALQEIDLRRDGRRALIADIDARVGETEEVLEARTRLDQARAELDALRRQQRDLDGQLEDLDAKIGPVETRLYGGSVRNPKELTDLQKELTALKARRSGLDDRGLSLLDAIEAAEDAVRRAEADLQRVEANWKHDQAALQAERARAEGESQSLLRERELRTAGMDPGALALYENLRGLKQGRPVARVERGICQGCRLTVPTYLVARIRAGGELIQCPSCERILVSG